MHHYGYFVLEFHYGVYSAEGDAVKRRGGGKGVDDEVCFVIDGYVVVLDEVFKEEGDIQFVGSFGAILVFFVERIYYLFSYHCILSFGDVEAGMDGAVAVLSACFHTNNAAEGVWFVEFDDNVVTM